MDAAGQPGAPAQVLTATATARVDESYLTVMMTPAEPRPDELTIGFDVLPAVTGKPFSGTVGDRQSDATFTLDLAGRTGQAYQRGPAPSGWQPVPNAGPLRYGTWDPADPRADSRALWHFDGADLVLRAPWALLGFSDPSAHRIGAQVSPGVTITLPSSGRTRAVTWPNWNRPYYTERLKQGAELFRDAALSVTNG